MDKVQKPILFIQQPSSEPTSKQTTGTSEMFIQLFPSIFQILGRKQKLLLYRNSVSYSENSPKTH
jgi:hypothetical protein